MQICIIATGYVGLVAGACFAEMGHVVTCVDANSAKVAQLARGIVAIYEPGLPDLVVRNLARGRLRFTTELARAAGAHLYFISVGTPSHSDGSPDLTQVYGGGESPRADARRARHGRRPLHRFRRHDRARGGGNRR